MYLILNIKALKSNPKFKTITVVSKEFNLPQHVLRFWESKFVQLSPLKLSGNHRYYRKADIELIRYIKSLLYDDCISIKGVQKIFGNQKINKLIKNTNPLLLKGSSSQRAKIEDIPDLKDNKKIDARGLEISKNNVQICISKGLSVIEGNAEKDLRQFPNLSFDYVILSQTLQAFYNPEKVIDDLLKISNKAIVTIPNFGFWKVRLHLFFKGTMPITKHLPNEWYNTPNLHMCTIKDFFNFCNIRKIKLFNSLALHKEKVSKITNSNLELKNLFSELGIFLIEK